MALSGSGKSSFLARIVEELLLTSSAHCFVIDPNSDFRYFAEAGAAAAWGESAYDSKKHAGKLFTERSAVEFKRRWSRVKKEITILTEDITGDFSTPKMRTPTIRWRDLPPDFLVEGLDSVHRVEMRHCHTFFKNLAEVFEFGLILRSRDGGDDIGHLPGSFDILRKVESTFSSLAEARSEGRLHGNEDILRLLEEELSQRMPLPGGRTFSDAKALVRSYVPREGRRGSSVRLRENYYYRRIARNLERSAVAFSHFTDVTGRHYFGLLEDLHGEGILSDRLATEEPGRVEILDLPSIKDPANRYLLVASYLDAAIARATRDWETARSDTYIDPNSRPHRHPMFVVLDEAHNLIPGDEATANPSLKLVRDRFRTIAAEGRKLGLFLLLATQRPDKIDKFVLSECQNKVVMRLDNEASLNFVAEALGMQDAKSTMRKRCMGSGYRVLLAGRWTRYLPVPMYPAPRRTMEGGGSLEGADWDARPDRPVGDRPSRGGAP